MKWLAILKLILDLISQLPFDATQPQIEAKVQEAMQSQEVGTLSVDGQAITGPQLEELIMHIVAVIMLLFKMRNPEAQEIPMLSHIYSLYRYGYLPGLTFGEALSITNSHRIDDAIIAYREFMQAPSTLSIDDLFAIPRCGMPDIMPDAVGSGSWPAGCHSTWPNNHAVKYQVNKSNMPSFLAPIFEEAWEMMAKAYADIGMVILRDDNDNRANSLVTFQRGAGWIGLAIVPQGPRCSDRIWAKFDTQYKPAALLDQWARLLCHEVGHNMGMGHTQGGIMNPSITSGPFTPTAWRGDPSFPKLQRFFGGEPVNPAPVWGIYPGGSDNS